MLARVPLRVCAASAPTNQGDAGRKARLVKARKALKKIKEVHRKNIERLDTLARSDVEFAQTLVDYLRSESDAPADDTDALQKSIAAHLSDPGSTDT